MQTKTNKTISPVEALIRAFFRIADHEPLPADLARLYNLA